MQVCYLAASFSLFHMKMKRCWTRKEDCKNNVTARKGVSILLSLERGERTKIYVIMKTMRLRQSCRRHCVGGCMCPFISVPCQFQVDFMIIVVAIILAIIPGKSAQRQATRDIKHMVGCLLSHQAFVIFPVHHCAQVLCW